jgi:hypothetical protein
MDQVDQYSYFTLGAVLSKLEQRPPAPIKLSDIFFDLMNASGSLDNFDRSPCTHSKEAAKDIESAIRNIFSLAQVEKEDVKKEVDFNTEIEPWALGQIANAIRDFKANFVRESPTLPIFFIPQKGLARTEQLVNNAELDFAPSVREALNQYPRVLEEIRQAGKALAFDLFTARVFHIMRAVEVLVLELLEKYKAKPAADSQRNLGAYVKLLKDKNADAELARFLDEVVRVERNEGIHPTKLFSEAQADMTYSIAKSAIIAVVEDLGKERALTLLSASA